jgi:hypothetical protein
MEQTVHLAQVDGISEPPDLYSLNPMMLCYLGFPTTISGSAFS